MDAPILDQRKETGLLQGFFPQTHRQILRRSTKRAAAVSPSSDKENMINNNDIDGLDQEESRTEEPALISNRRKALFEPLEPTKKAKRPSNNEALLPPPDFDAASYPKGWLIGKKRKLVNVDVVESMRRIAIQEMNRKDREIDGLNEQLEEDARCLEHLQLQLLQERSKRSEVERQNTMLQDQISMLMNMLQESQEVDEEDTPADP